MTSGIDLDDQIIAESSSLNGRSHMGSADQGKQEAFQPFSPDLNRGVRRPESRPTRDRSDPRIRGRPNILLHPPKNSRMAQSDASLRHHLDEVTEAQFKCDVPSHTQNDDLLVKVPSLEQILCRGRCRHPGSYRRIPSISTVYTRTLNGICCR